MLRSTLVGLLASSTDVLAQCNPYQGAAGIACQCQSRGICDTVEVPSLQPGGSFSVLSQSNEAPWQPTSASFIPGKQPDYSDPDNVITVTLGKNQGVKPNIMHGFGGQLNDATAINLDNVDSSLQFTLLEDLFDPELGLGYRTIRVPMGGTEYSERFYTYDDVYGDEELESWALQPEDTEYKIPIIQKIQSFFFDNPDDLTVIATPWTAPNWMKTNDAPTGPATIIGHPWPEHPRADKGYFTIWANYFVKFVQAYQAKGINVDALTMQNLPSNGFDGKPYLPIPSVALSPLDSGMFLTNYLDPAMVAAGIDMTYIACDDYTIEVGTDTQSTYALAYSYGMLDKIYGAGVHWDYDISFGAGLSTGIYEVVESRYPLPIITTQGGILSTHSTPASDNLGNWDHGVKYSESMIISLNAGVTTFIDGSMVLNMNGGPNTTVITGDAPIIVSDDGGTFYKNPSYYHIAHIAKFILPGSDIVPIQKVGLFSTKLKAIAAENADLGTKSLVMLNKDSTETLNIQLFDKEVNGTMTYSMPPESIMSITWQLNV